MPSTPTRRAQARRRQERLLLGAVLVAVGLFGCWSRYTAYRGVDTEQRHLLDVQALAIDENLSRHLIGVAAALHGVRDDLPAWPADQIGPNAARRLKALSDAMPGVRSMLLLDRDGRVLASDGAEAVGRDLGARADFQQARARPDPKRLSLSAPFASPPGPYSMSLTLALAAADGSFAGAISATLDPAYLRLLLRSALYAGDVWAAIAHGDGVALMIEPNDDKVVGANLARPGSMFQRHREAGQVNSLLTGTVAATGEPRLMAQRTVQPAELSLDKPLVIAVSRSLDAMFAPWWRETGGDALLYLLLCATTSIALIAIQRRRGAIDRFHAERDEAQRQSAERLELALRGADLGLWDYDLRSGTTIVNERWSSMLGLPHEAVSTGLDVWRSRVHPDDWARVIAAQQAHVDGHGERFEQTYRMRHGDGRWLWILDRGQVLERDAQGRPLRMVGTHMDITQRMHEQLALESSEQSLATTLYSIGDAVIATDPQGRVVRMNGTAERLTGWAAAEALGQPLATVFRIVGARTREPAIDPVEQVIAHGEVVGLANDTLLLARDGSEYQIADSAAPIRTPAGEITGVVLVFSDVTERYRSQQALRANEERLRSLLANLGAGVIVHGPDGELLDANPSATRIVGLTLDQMRGKAVVDPYWAFLEEDGAPMPHERFPVSQVLARGSAVKNLVLGVRRADLERPLWVLVNAYPVRDAQGQIDQIVVTFSDITERKEAEEELRLLAAAVGRLNDVVMITEADPVEPPGPRIVFVNQAFERITGWRRDEVIGRTPRLLQGPKTDPAELARIGAALRRGEPAHAELINYTKQGAEFWVEFDIVPLADGSGRVTHLVSVERDITELKQAEQRVLAAQGELEATLAAIPDLLFEVGADGRILNFRSPRHDLLAMAPDAFLGRQVAEVLPPDAATVVTTALQQAGASGFSGGLQYGLSLPGGPHWFELSVARKPMPGDEAARFIVLARDITERKHSEAEREALERQLREAQKIESIGTLAGGIAHDFNNILAAILGNVALAREDVAAGHPATASLDQINRAGLRARHLVQQILTFSRRDQRGLTQQPLGPVVEETLQLLRSTLPASVRLDVVRPDTPVAVRCDSTQLQQVLLNLCTNAWHALPEQGGRIEVGFERTLVDDTLRQRVPGLPPGACVHLWVRDNGSGMDEATRLRIFDPFFTTKTVGQGTGLGLSVVHGIVRAHDGAIALDTAPGQGSSFHVYFPWPEADMPEPAPERTLAGGPRGAGQHVLYIDDDEVMVVLVERLLARAGFRVTVDTDAVAALARLRAEPLAFDAVVTDFNMPELSGIEVATQIAAIRPGLPVVISSGFLSEALRAQAAGAGVRALVQKENTAEELAGVLQKLLAPAAP